TVSALALRVALEGGSARQVLECTERWRARALWHPTRPPADDALAGALADLRQVTAELETALLSRAADAAVPVPGGAGGGAPGTGGGVAGAAAVRGPTGRAGRLQARKAALEDRVRRLARKAAGSQYSSHVDPPTVPQLAA